MIESLFRELPGTSFYYEARHSLLQIGNAGIPALIETLERKNKAVEQIRLPSGVNIAEGAIEGKAAFVLGSLRAQEAEKQMLNAFNTYYSKYQNRERTPIFASVPGAVAEIAYSLGNIGTEASVRSLTSLAQETDANLRIAATEALTYIGATSSVTSLLAAAKTGDVAARRAAAWGCMVALVEGEGDVPIVLRPVFAQPVHGVDMHRCKLVGNAHRVRLFWVLLCHEPRPA